MGDDPEAGDQKSASEQPQSPAPPVKSQRASTDQGAASSGQSANGKRNGALSLIAELNANEKVTAFLAAATILVSIASLAISFLTYLNAPDTSDLKHAVGHLAALADQTKRQADAQNGQLAIMRDQVAALRDQLAEAKSQTKAISEQTIAIKRSATAAIQSADAQRRTADLEAIARRPALALHIAQVSDLDAKPTKEGIVNVGVMLSFSNAGGVAIHDPVNQQVFLIADNLPDRPDYSRSTYIGGNDITLMPGQSFSNTELSKYQVIQDVAHRALNHLTNIYVYGIVDYEDTNRTPHRFCYAYQIDVTPGKMTTFVQRGGPAYHCNT